MSNLIFEKIKVNTAKEDKINEIGSGILVERRRLLWLPLVTAAAILFPQRVLSNRVPASLFDNGIDWETFTEDVTPNAKKLHKDSSTKGQDAYLFWLASMAARLNFGTIPKAKLQSFANLNPPVETGLSHRGVPFFVIEWKMSPNAYLPPHNHPNISVCTVCTKGSARLRNFNPVGDLPDFSSKLEFSVQKTHDEVLTPGRINTLSAIRDNIHTFKAGPDGASGIDITTYHDKDVGFSFLDIDEKPSNTENRIYRAAWNRR